MTDTDSFDSLTTNELADTTEQTQYRLVPLDSALLTNPSVLRAMAGITIGLAILVWPNRSDQILARLVGGALIWLALTSLRGSLGRSRTGWINLVTNMAGLTAGVALMFLPNQPATFLGRFIGGVLVVIAIRDVATRRRSDLNWALITPRLTYLAAGALLLLYPEQILAATTSVAAAGWILLSILVVVVSLDARTAGTTSYRGATELIVDWLNERPKSVDTRQALYTKILYEGPNTRQRIIRFFALMGFATVIASMGVLTDSTAVVIGAMLIAPLMTPLMGMAISLVMGWPNRLARSAVIAAGGIAFAVAIGALIGLIAPTVIDTATNAQIAARSNPTILDLIIAVAAGGAGAYGLSRPDVSDSLPGVAIAISLVPPLAVVGIAFSQGDWSQGTGALLLFTTNMLAILTIGGLTFILTGVTPLTQVAKNQHRIRTALAAVGIAAAIVIAALVLNGTQTATNLLDQSRAETTVTAWLSSAPKHRFVRANITDSTVTVTVVGPSAGLPDVAVLADDLSGVMDRTITADVRLIVEEQLTATGGSS